MKNLLVFFGGMHMRDKKLTWCRKQKHGIELIEPNQNVSSAYLKKAHTSLRSMDINYKESILDWTVDAAYYARYQAVYALMQRIGVKCEIHDCTIELFRFLFNDSFDEELFLELKRAKEQRINLTYYTDRLVSVEDIKKNVYSASNFVLKVEEFLSVLTPSKIKLIKEKLVLIFE